MIKLIVVLFFSCFVSSHLSATDYLPGSFKKDFIHKNRRAKYPLGVNLLLLGPSELIGASVDFYLTSNVNFEFGLGLDNNKAIKPNYFAGLKYHLLGSTITNTTFYAGGYFKNNFENSTNSILQEFYFPIGLQKIKKNKFTWNIELAYKYDVQNEKSIVWGSFKIGYRFKIRKSRLNLN